jgi:hypothetical protein
MAVHMLPNAGGPVASESDDLRKTLELAIENPELVRPQPPVYAKSELRIELEQNAAAWERKEKERVDEAREATRVAQQQAQRELQANVTAIVAAGVEAEQRALAQEREAARAAQDAERAARRAKAGSHPAIEKIAEAEGIAKSKILEMIRESPTFKTAALREMKEWWVASKGATSRCIPNLTERALERTFRLIVDEAKESGIILEDSPWARPGPVAKSRK